MLSKEDKAKDDDKVGEPAESDRFWISELRHSTLGFLATHPKWVQVGIGVVVIGSTTIGIALWWGGFLHITDAGYFATFYLNLVGAATIILPLPGVLVACVAAESSLGLNPILIGVFGSAGATLGETTAYLVGYAGQNTAMKLRWYPRIHRLMENNGAATLFVLSMIPTPLFDLAGIAAGALEYPYKKFLLYVFAGKATRLIMMAYACRSGIDWIKDIYEFQLPIL